MLGPRRRRGQCLRKQLGRGCGPWGPSSGKGKDQPKQHSSDGGWDPASLMCHAGGRAAWSPGLPSGSPACPRGWLAATQLEAPFLAQPFLSAPPLPGLLAGVTNCCLPRVPLASGTSIHFLPVSRSNHDLMGSLRHSDCSIIIRPRNCQGTEGHSQWLC